MKRKLFRLLPAVPLALMILFTQAGLALAVDYYITVNVSSQEGTQDYSELAIVTDVNNQELADLDYISDSALDTRVTYAGSELPHMVAEDKLAFVAPEVNGGIGYDFRYTMGNDPLSSFAIVPGYDGYATISDDAALELGSDFEIEVDGYVDTETGDGKYLLYKPDSFVAYISNDGEITAGIIDNSTTDTETLRPNAAGDEESIPNLVDSTHWGATSDQSNATYVWRSGAGDPTRDLYNLPAYTGGSSISKVTGWVRGKEGAEGSGGGSTSIKTHGTVYDQAVGFSETIANYSYDWTVNPYTGEQWTINEVNSLQAGVELSSSTTGSAYCYEVWIVVTYITGFDSVSPSVTATGVSSGEHKVKVGIFDDVTSDCCEFSGPGSEDNVNAGTDASFNVANFTIECWIYMTDLSTSESYHVIADKGAGAGTDGLMVAVTTAGEVSFYTYSGGTPGYYTTSSNTITTGSWHYVVAYWSSGNKCVWVDNTQYQVEGDAYAFHDASDWLIGQRSASYGDFRGKIEEMRFSDTVRSPAEIAAAWNSGDGARLTADGNTIALWHFDEGTGNTAYDSTTTNDGTLSGGVTWETGYIPEPALTIKIDDVLKDSTSWINESVPDNSNDWILLEGNSMPYAEYYKHTVSGTLVAWYQPITMISGTTLPDREGTAQDATITWGSLPTGITASTGELVILNLQKMDPETEEAYLEIFGEPPPEPEGLYDADDYDALPTSEAVNELLAAGQIPLKLFWIPVILGIAIFAGLFIYGKTRSILAVAIAGGVVIGFFYIVGMLPWWIFVPYGIMATTMCVSERTYGF